MCVAGSRIGSIEVQILPVTYPRHQLDAEEEREAEDRRALSLRVRMDGVGLNLRAVLADEVQDGVSLPGTTGNEPREQSDVGVGDEIVADPAIAAVADVIFGHQALRVDV